MFALSLDIMSSSLFMLKYANVVYWYMCLPQTMQTSHFHTRPLGLNKMNISYISGTLSA